MKKEQENINNGLQLRDDSSAFFSKVEVPWERSSEAVWQSFGKQLDTQRVSRRLMSFPGWRLAVAAAVLVFAAVTSLMRFYTQTVETQAGQHLTYLLPDRSVVELNAASSLSYHPYWWRFSRKVTLSGEAFFKVEKGKKFEVASVTGRTIVLGTSFNVYARDEKYQVTCVTGKVKVVAGESRNAVILNSREKADLNANGIFAIRAVLSINNEVSWIGNSFFFTNAPLREVLDEIERQYGVTIRGTVSPGATYTGNFSKETSINQVLDIVSKPFNIIFIQKNEGEYQLLNDREK